MSDLELGVLVSGRGSNLQAIVDAITGGRLRSQVRLVISNKPGAPALERAAQAGIPTLVIPHAEFPSREAFDAALVSALEHAGARFVVLAGFMRVLSPTFLGAFRDRVINIHPALLPMFPGSHAQRQALDYGVKVTGCTVHFVDEGVDTGPIILQKVVEVRDDDDETSLSERLLSHEHEALIQTLELLEQQRIRLERRAGAARPRVVTKPQ